MWWLEAPVCHLVPPCVSLSAFFIWFFFFFGSLPTRVLAQRRPIEVCRPPRHIQHQSHLESFSTAILLQCLHFSFAPGNGKTCERGSITARQSNGNGSVYSSGTALERNVSTLASSCAEHTSLWICAIAQLFIQPYIRCLESLQLRVCERFNNVWAMLSNCRGSVS